MAPTPMRTAMVNLVTKRDIRLPIDGRSHAGLVSAYVDAEVANRGYAYH